MPLTVKHIEECGTLLGPAGHCAIKHEHIEACWYFKREDDINFNHVNGIYQRLADIKYYYR